MNIKEYLELKNALEALGEGFNERFEKEREATLKVVVSMFDERDKQSLRNSDDNVKTGSTYVGSEDHQINKLTNYIQTLIQVQGVGHKVNTEIDEAIEKLKELTYA